MGTWQWGLVAWMVGSLLALLFAFVNPGEGWSAFDRIVQGVSAVGTFAAAVIALRLGTEQTREAQRRELVSAELMAAALADLLDQALGQLQIPTINVAMANDQLGQDPTYASVFQVNAHAKELRAALEGPAFEISHDSIAKLAPLKGECAFRLLRAQAAVLTLKHEIDTEWKGDGWEMRSHESRIAMILRWSSIAFEAATTYAQVSAQLHEISKPHAGDEMFRLPLSFLNSIDTPI